MAKPWEKYGSAQPSGGVFALPPTEEEQRQARNEARRLQLAEDAAARADQAQRDAANDRRTSIEIQLAKDGLMMGPDGQITVNPNGPIVAAKPTLTAKERSDALERYRAAERIERNILAARGSYAQGPGDTTGIFGIADFMPTEANQRFDRAGQRFRGDVKKLLGFTGGEGNTLGESSQLYDPYLPDSWDKGGTVEDKFLAVSELAEDARAEAIAILGGVPDANGRVTPMSPEQIAALKPSVEARDPLAALYTNNGTQRQAAGFTATTETVPVPPAMQAEYEQFMAGWLRNPDQGAYVQFRNGLDRKYGYPSDPVTQQNYADFAAAAAQKAQTGGTVGLGIPGTEQPMNADKIAGNVMANAATLPANAIDALAMGAPSALLRQFAPGAAENFDAATAANPGLALTGQVLGAIGGTKGIGAVGRTLADKLGRAGAVLKGGGTTGDVARNIGTDAAYAGTYSGTQGQDPLTGAALGVAGSLGGQMVGSGIGRALTGVKSSPSVNLLREQGVTPTIGQIMRGRAADNGGRSLVAGLEDTIANTSMAGTAVNAARGRALEQANTGMYNVASGGAPITGFGEDALLQLGRVKTQAYDDFARSASIPADDARFMAQMDAIDAGRGEAEFGDFIDKKLKPAMGGSQPIAGQRLQEALRMLATNKGQYRTAATMTPAMGDVADAIGQAENAFIGNAARNSPQAIPMLKVANRLNRNLSILDDAAGAAVNNGGVVTGAQLGTAIAKDAGRFSGGRGLSKRATSPLHKYQQAMQAVLPNQVPPTGVNTAPALALGGAALGVGNEAGGFDSNIARVLAATALLSTPYTKAGAKTVAKAMLDRPQSLRAIGSKVRKKKGLFGAAAVPLMLESGQ